LRIAEIQIWIRPFFNFGLNNTDSHITRPDSIRKKSGPITEATILKEAIGGKSGLGKKGAALAEGAAQVGSRTTKEEGRNHWLYGLFAAL